MDIAELRNKLNNIAAELAEQDVQQEDIAIEEEQVEENSYNDYMADLKAREKAAGVSDDFLTRAGQDYDALMKAYADKINDKPSGKLDDPTTKLPQISPKADPSKLDDPTTKLPQISPKKKMGKLDDPTTKLPQVREEEVEETVEVPVSALAELMQLAGYSNYADKLQEYENEPEEEYSDTEDQLIGLSGGLNGPKKMYPAAAGGDNPMDQEPREIEESMGIAEVENTLYKSYRAFLEEAEINEEEE